MAAMYHEAQIVTENKMLAEQAEDEGDGAIKTQRQQPVEKEIEAVIRDWLLLSSTTKGAPRKQKVKREKQNPPHQNQVLQTPSRLREDQGKDNRTDRAPWRRDRET